MYVIDTVLIVYRLIGQFMINTPHIINPLQMLTYYTINTTHIFKICPVHMRVVAYISLNEKSVFFTILLTDDGAVNPQHKSGSPHFCLQCYFVYVV